MAQFFRAALLAALLGGTAMAGTLEAVKARDTLVCGVIRAAQDWTKDDVHGDLSALESEICRAASMAVLGRIDGVTIKPFPDEADALLALHDGTLDMLAGATPSVTSGRQYGAAFGPVIFWDSQGFLVHAQAGHAGLAQLAGKTVCFLDGTDIAATLLSGMATRGPAFLPFPFQEEGEMAAGLAGGHCTAVGASFSALAGMRAEMRSTAPDLVLLPDSLSVVPLVVATRAGDAAWTTVAATVVDVLVLAEMRGVTQENLHATSRGDDVVTRHLLGADWSAATALGLAHDFAAREIGAVGNYGNVYERTVGQGSALRLPRGLNALCTQGGAICAAPLR